MWNKIFYFSIFHVLKTTITMKSNDKDHHSSQVQAILGIGVVLH